MNICPLTSTIYFRVPYFHNYGHWNGGRDSIQRKYKKVVYCTCGLSLSDVIIYSTIIFTDINLMQGRIFCIRFLVQIYYFLIVFKPPTLQDKGTCQNVEFLPVAKSLLIWLWMLVYRITTVH